MSERRNAEPGLVTDWRYTTAKAHDGRYLDEMTGSEQKLVAADIKRSLCLTPT